MPTRLSDVEQRAERAKESCEGADLWEWQQVYGLGDGGDLHWCLVDPDGDTSRTLDLFTITLTASDRALSGEPYNCTAVPRYIESMPPALALKLCRALRIAVAVLDETAKSAGGVSERHHIVALIAATALREIAALGLDVDPLREGEG